jgi:hypothetical protein
MKKPNAMARSSYGLVVEFGNYFWALPLIWCKLMVVLRQ